MVWAISYAGPPSMYNSEPRIMYEPKRSEITSRAYGNCIIPTTHGFSLVCM